MAKTTREVERERKLLALADEWDETSGTRRVERA
jgi:hypothetical protein